MTDFDHCPQETDKLKVSIRQSEGGRKKKIKLENDFMKITIRVKDDKADWPDDDFEIRRVK